MNKSKIKVIEVIADSDLSGGPKHVLSILNFIDKEFFDCYLICPKGNLAKEARKIKGVSVFEMKMNSKFNIFSILKLNSIIDKIRSNSSNPFGPTIVHSHGLRAGFLSRMFKNRNAVSIYTEHRVDDDYYLKNEINDSLQKKILSYLNKKQTDLIIAVSTSVYNYIKNTGVEKSKLFLIPNGINLDFAKPKKIRELNKAPIIGTIGNLNLQKGHEYLISAMPLIIEKFPHATLEIIGSGERQQELNNLVKKLGLRKHVALLGQKENVAKYMKDWDIFVLPSIAETFGIVILEAMLMGLPVVATNVGGVSDIISNDKNGILVKPKNSKSIAKSVVDLIDHPAVAARYKRVGLETIKKFDWKVVIKEIEKVYKDSISAT